MATPEFDPHAQQRAWLSFVEAEAAHEACERAAEDGHFAANPTPRQWLADALDNHDRYASHRRGWL